MKYRVNRPLIKQQAKIAFFKNWPTFLLAGLIIVVINTLLTSMRTHFLPQLVVTVPTEILSDTEAMTRWMMDWAETTFASLDRNFWLIFALISIVELLVSIPLRFGFYQLCWKAVRGEEDLRAIHVFTWITDGRRVLGSIGMMILTGLLTMLWALLFSAPALLLMALMLLLPTLSLPAALGLMGLLYVLLLAAALCTLVRTLGYNAAQYLYASQPELGMRPALREVKSLLKGRRWELFVLYVSFALWLLASELTYGVGDLFVTPYLCMTVILFLAAVKQGPVPPPDGDAPPVDPRSPVEPDEDNHGPY